MKVLYRISNNSNPKAKICDKFTCLQNFLAVFPHNKTFLFGDNLNLETRLFVKGQIKDTEVRFKDLGSLGNSRSFMHVFNYALDHFPDNEFVYLVEDDYLHLPGAYNALTEISQLDIDYATLYDHPDKYSKLYDYGADATRVFTTPSLHWKQTVSTTMTIFSKVKTLREDFDKWHAGCCTNPPLDHKIFLSLSHRILVSSIPGLSTHVEAAFLSPVHDWRGVVDEYK